MCTDDLLQSVISLWAEGMSAREIGQKIGMSRNAVIGKVNRARDNGEPLEKRTTQPVSKFAAPKVKRRAANGERERPVSTLLPPAQASPSTPKNPPPPKSAPVGEIDGWDGLIAEISQLTQTQCRWPLGDPVEGFCRAPVEDRGAYCEYHRKRAYRSPYNPVTE